MGLSEITDIGQSVAIDDQGALQDVFVIRFQTEATSGRKSIEIPASEFTPDVASARAEARAEEIDRAVTGET
jgi:hypothetical protein